MVKITYDKYTNKYFLAFTDSNVVALDFTEVEALSEQLKDICREQLELSLQFDVDNDCGDACKI
jgi:hypothetical protein